MNSRGKVKRVFPGGNTPMGFHSFFDYIIWGDYVRRYIIKGGPGAGKSTFMTGIETHMLDLGFDVVEYRCPTDPDSLDAISIPELGIALLDGTSPHTVDPRNPGITDDIIWLGQYWDDTILAKYREEILQLNKRGARMFKSAYNHLREARVAYDEWRSYAEDDFDEGEYNSVLGKVMVDFFKGYEDLSPRAAHHTHIFATAISGKGVYNYTDCLVEPSHKVYAFSGRPGSGVGRAIGRLARQAEELGLSTQQFHSPIDIDELDILILPHLNRVLVNVNQILGNDNSLLQDRSFETHIDFDDYLKDKNKTVLEFADDMEAAKKRFYHLIDRAVDFISRAREVHGQLERYYIEAMDFDGVNAKREEVLREILRLSEIS
ncbi:MAG: hypothetical protein GX340_01290 [Clostridiales bacterium]|jgi:hypothetical protein|nr:hypothetical protein [Clostridiales bacterium]